jgi:hypothetical protein
MDQLNLLSDDVRRALANEIARELVRCPDRLGPLIKDIVLRVVVHYDAIEKLDRCRRALEMFTRDGFKLSVQKGELRVYPEQRLPADLKAVLEVYRHELTAYVERIQQIEGFAPALEKSFSRA